MVPWTSTSTTHSTPLLLFAGASSVSSTGGSFSFSFLIFFNSCIFGPPAREAFLSALPQINWLMVKLVADNFKCFSPFSSCQIQESQQVRFKPCFSKRQCSFGQQPCPQPPHQLLRNLTLLSFVKRNVIELFDFHLVIFLHHEVSRAEKAVHGMHNVTAFPNTLHFRNKSISLSPGMQKLSAHKANSPECSKKAQKANA